MFPYQEWLLILLIKYAYYGTCGSQNHSKSFTRVISVKLVLFDREIYLVYINTCTCMLVWGRGALSLWGFFEKTQLFVNFIMISFYKSCLWPAPTVILIAYLKMGNFLPENIYFSYDSILEVMEFYK